jgi:ATP-binding cassette subfamily B protein
VLAISAVILAVYLLGKRTRPAGLRLQTAVGELAGTMSRALGAMRTIRATSATRRESDAAVRRAASALDAGFVGAKLRAAIQTFTGLTVQLLLIAVVAVGALRVASGDLSVGDLSAFIMYLLLMVAPLTLFTGIASMLGEAFGALSRIMQVQAAVPEPDVQDAAAPLPLPISNGTRRPFFELANVSFRYPERSSGGDNGATPALTDVSLRFEAGKTTAVVGPSGAGKSTLFALLERFYEPGEGSILFRGEDVLRLSREQLRGQIAYVEQDAPALSGTVRDNLLLGSHAANDQQCVDVLRQVNLLPPGASGLEFLDSEVGELGSLLSGGERQRLAIARALIARTPILLLDEVTSNLDSNNERLIQDVLHAKDGKRSIIVIAHRLSTVVAADTIVVLDGGRVVAQGTHQELLNSSPLYREFAHTQLLD